MDIFRLASTSLLVRVVGMGFGFVFAILVARQVSQEMYGYYSILIAWMLPLSALAGLGTDKLAMKRIAVDLEHGGGIYALEVYRRARLLTWGLACILALLVLLVPVLFESVSSRFAMFYLLGLAIPFYAALILNCYVLKSMDRQPLSIFLEMTFPIGLTLVLAAFCIFVLRSPEMVLHMYVLSLIASWLASQWVVTRWAKGLKPQRQEERKRVVDVRQMIQEAFPMYVTALVTALMVSVDVIMLSWFVPPEQVAIYSVAMRIMGLMTFPLAGIVHVVGPRYAAAYSREDFGLLRDVHQKGTSLAVSGALPLIVLIVAFPADILGLFGDGFQEGAIVLYILLLGQLANLLVGPIGYLLWMADLAHSLQRLMLWVLAMNLGLNACLIPLFGLAGAAIATSAALLLKNLGSMWLTRKHLGFYGFFCPGELFHVKH